MTPIEHVAMNVADPRAMADWYVRHLGMKVILAGGPPAYGHFLADAAGRVVLEIYRNPSVAVPDYAAMPPATLHLAFVVKDLPADHARLLAAGATPAEAPYRTDAGDQIAVVRDPWGLAVQLVRRTRPLVP